MRYLIQSFLFPRDQRKNHSHTEFYSLKVYTRDLFGVAMTMVRRSPSIQYVMTGTVIFSTMQDLVGGRHVLLDQQ